MKKLKSVLIMFVIVPVAVMFSGCGRISLPALPNFKFWEKSHANSNGDNRSTNNGTTDGDTDGGAIEPEATCECQHDDVVTFDDLGDIVSSYSHSGGDWLADVYAQYHNDWDVVTFDNADGPDRLFAIWGVDDTFSEPPQVPWIGPVGGVWRVLLYTYDGMFYADLSGVGGTTLTWYLDRATTPFVVAIGTDKVYIWVEYASFTEMYSYDFDPITVEKRLVITQNVTVERRCPTGCTYVPTAV